MWVVAEMVGVAVLVVLLCAALLFPELAEGIRRQGGLLAQEAGTYSQTRLSFFRRHWLVLLVAGILLVVPTTVILFTRQTVLLDDFQVDDMAESSSMIAQLLRGERLAPPPPAPPELFTTLEIRRLRPELVTADRRWEGVEADMQQRVLAIFEVMRRQYGYELVLVEGYRSPERQAALAAEGKATRAGAWQSCHQYGLGVDSALLRDGKLQWDMEDEWVRRGYTLYGQLAVQAGLDWGGNWQSIKDYVHVEMASSCRQARKERRAALTATP